MQQTPENANLALVIEKPYELRLPEEHSLLVQIIKQAMPSLTFQQARNMSLYIQLIKQCESTLLFKRYWLIHRNRQENKWQLVQQYQIGEISNPDELNIFIAKQNFEKCLSFSGTIESQVKKMHQYVYFQDMPRSKLYNVLKNCQKTVYSFGQNVYQQGDTIFDTFAYYLVVSGNFSFNKKSQIGYSVDVYSFRQGYYFGGQMSAKKLYLQQQQRKQMIEMQAKYGIQKKRPFQPPQVRKFTVTCKSSTGIIYRLPYTFVEQYLTQYCDQYFQNHNMRLNLFLQKQMSKVQKQRQGSSRLLSQKIMRRTASSLVSFTSKAISSARSTPMPPQKQPVKDIRQKSSDYKILRQFQPTRNRLYSKNQLLKIQFDDPEKVQSDWLLWKKAKCTRTRQLSKPSTPPPSRQEIMFSFLNSMVRFHHSRKKSILNL